MMKSLHKQCQEALDKIAREYLAAQGLKQKLEEIKNEYK